MYDIQGGLFVYFILNREYPTIQADNDKKIEKYKNQFAEDYANILFISFSFKFSPITITIS